MPYQGRHVNTDKTTNLRKVDSIAAQFTGAQTVFSITSSNAALFPGNARNLQIAVNGVWQEPDAAYSVAGSTITFSTAPAANSTFHGIVLGEVAAFPPASTGPTQTFRGLTIRTHPDADVEASKVWLDHADEIVMNDGTRVLDWNDLACDITVSGANGLDTGVEGASRWYSIWAIRNSSTGTKGLLLHRPKDYFLDESQTTNNNSTGVNDAGVDTYLAQSFDTDLSGPIPFIDVTLVKTGTPTGTVYWEIQADSAGSPSGTALATSDKLNATLVSTSAQAVRVIFRSPYSVTAGTTYWLVAKSTYAQSGSHYLAWNRESAGAYTGHTGKRYNGSVWSDLSADFWFKVYITQNDTALTLPSGYDQYCLIGWVYNNSGSDFVQFKANDREVSTEYTSLVISGAATVATLLDATTAIPPVSGAITMWENYQTTSGATIQIQPDLRSINYYGSLVQQTSPYNIDRYYPIRIEFQHFYYFVSSGATHINSKGYCW